MKNKGRVKLALPFLLHIPSNNLQYPVLTDIEDT
jgi:hypothetical protein